MNSPLPGPVLVTGATGMVGGHLLRRLAERGFDVLAVYRNPKGKEHVRRLFRFYGSEPAFDRIRWIQGDTADPCFVFDIVPQAPVIVHGAAKISFSPRDKKEMYRTNVEGTAHLINAALDSGTSYLVHISSIAALGGNRSPKTERAVWTWAVPHTTYGATKFLSEMEVWRGMEEGLRAAVINPSVIVSPFYYDRGLGQTVDRLYRRRLPFYTDGSTGYVHVRDVTEIILRLIERQISGERYILNGGHMQVRDMLYLLADTLGVPPPRYRLPRKIVGGLLPIYNTLARLTGKFTELAPVEKEALDALWGSETYDSSKARREFDYEFIPPEEALKELAEVYLRCCTPDK
ncbi:MAG: NAD-dependent epimerase/dehydratase family protein [Chlorobi bacterium]|nr:NAD-dependent epimerase/dehydratase family protein [Chlorobiota bacterium]